MNCDFCSNEATKKITVKKDNSTKLICDICILKLKYRANLKKKNGHNY